MEYIVKTDNDNKAVSEIIKGWGSDILVSRGKPHKAQDLDGILVYENEEIIGLGLYYIENNECEIALLETFIQNKGIGTKIIEKVIKIAKENMCKRIWLVTTNSNINAIKFYQKRGFDISNIYINAMDEARKIKPEIPEIAENGIKIKDEIEFEIKFCEKIMEIKTIVENKEGFMDLLLLADEQEEMIKKYLYRGELFALYDEDLKTVSVVTQEDDDIYEIKNIATYEKYQGKGYGTYMIKHIIENYKNKCKTLLVGTGEDKRIISFYESFGFRYSHTEKDFFIKNYDHEMYENGKQLTDMIYLKMEFSG